MSTDAKRYYAVLGVDPLASAEAIHVAFRRRAKELHPDAQSGDATAFILLKRAYDTLHNPVDRAAYDRVCAPAPPIDPPAPHADSYRRAQPMPAPPSRMQNVHGGPPRGVASAFDVMSSLSSSWPPFPSGASKP